MVPAGWGQAEELTRDEATMNYKFKLARRLARLRAGTVGVAAVLFTQSCTSDPATGPDSGSPGGPPRVSVAPESVLIAVNQAIQFQASADNAYGNAVLSSPSGGKARGRLRRTVAELTVAPHSVVVAGGSVASFTATAMLGDSTTAEPSVIWTATGGTIDTHGKYTAGANPGTFAVSATASNGVADTAVITITESTPAISDIALSPTSASLAVGGSKRFLAVGKATDGTTIAVSPKYGATGGTISGDGVYQAGQTPGTFRVIATDTSSNLADTAAVIIEAPSPTLQAVAISPETVSLLTSATQQFTAIGRLSDGTSSAITVSWSATGGSISSSGLYLAGQAGGTFQVIATQLNGTLADTAKVTITTPPLPSPAPPPPSDGKSFFSADAEGGTMVPPWASWGVVKGGDGLLPTNSTAEAKNGARSFKYEYPASTVHANKSMTMQNKPQVDMGGPSGHFMSGYYSFWVYVDEGFTDTGTSHGPWNMIMGWMTGVAGAPDPISDVGIERWNGKLQVIYTLKNASTNPNRYYSAPAIAGYDVSNGWYRMTSSSPAGIVEFPRKQWVHLCVYYKMSKTNGRVTIWQDGTKIMDLTAPTMDTFTGWILDVGHNTAGDMLLQLGNYGGGNTTTQRLYIDDFKVTDYQVVP